MFAFFSSRILQILSCFRVSRICFSVKGVILNSNSWRSSVKCPPAPRRRTLLKVGSDFIPTRIFVPGMSCWMMKVFCLKFFLNWLWVLISSSWLGHFLIALILALCSAVLSLSQTGNFSLLIFCENFSCARSAFIGRRM